MNIQLGNKIGEGVSGTTYEAKFNQDNCLYKIQKYDHSIHDFSNQYARLVDFNQKVAKKYPQLFMVLISHGFIEKCSHKQTIPKWARGSFRKELIERNKKDACLFMVYNPIYKITLGELWPSLTNREYFKCCVQIAEQFKIMHENNFYHTDAHSQNIMIDYSGNYHLIDYDNVYSDNYPLNNYDKHKLANYGSFRICDFCYFLMTVVVKQYRWIEFISNNKYKLAPFVDFRNALLGHPNLKEVMKHMPRDSPKTKKEFKNISNFHFILIDVIFSIIYPQEYYRIYGINNWKSLPNMFDQFEAEFVFYVIKNYQDWNLIIREARRKYEKM